MPFELVMRLGQPFDALIGDKHVTLPMDGAIRIQFVDEGSARVAFGFLRGNTSIRQCRDESDGYTNPVVQGEVITEQSMKAKRRELLEYTERSNGWMSPDAEAELARMRSEDAGDQQQ